MTPARELIAERAHANVYAWSGPEGRLVMKVLHATSPSPRELLGFDNALAVTTVLEGLGGVASAIRKERVEGRHALLLRYAPGEPLDRWAARIGRAPGRIARAAVAIARTLGEMHERGVVHKDVKPSHIVFDEASARATLLDFAIAARVDHVSPEAATPDALEGTLAYMSPEQTGRVNRVVDYRTDLYSLGATIYELLLGRPPFEAQDAGELVHCHIARTPLSPQTIDPRIPPALSDIVLRLLSKSPEERYKGAVGLAHDLERCANAIDATGRAPRFSLGARDFSERLHVEPKLYGRERELAAMTRAFEGACEGRVVWILLAGEPGAGKSSLADELRGPVAAKRGVFAQGKFEQLQRSTPYFGLGRALGHVTTSILTQDESTLAATRARIAGAVGNRGKALATIVPNLELLLGPLPEPPALGGAEAQRRLHYVARSFLHACATASSPLVLVLDDLQWADPASLALVEQIVTDREGAHLTLVGTYRPGEVDAEHPLTALLAATHANPPLVLDVPALSPGDVLALVADTLHATHDEARDLASLVSSRTAGNPFFVRQFLRALWEKGALSFDGAKERWTWSLDRARALGITGNVVALMTSRIQALPEEAQHVLRFAACVGGRFDIATLAHVSGLPVARAAADAWASVREGLLVPFGDAYRIAAATEPTTAAAEYSFVHDRVQQAAYALTGEQERKAIHHEIGRLLHTRARPDDDGESLFDVVRHLNLAGDVVKDARERRDLAALNLAAGRRARASAAYVQAASYFRAGIALLTDDAWTRDYDLAIALFAEASDAAYLAGDYDEAVRTCRIAVECGKSPLDKVKAFDSLVMTAMARDDLAGAIDAGIAALRELGVHFPAAPKTPHIIFALLRTKMALAGRPTESLADLPPMTDASVIAAMRLIERMIPAAFRSGSKLFPLFVFRLVNLSLTHGNMPVSCFAYAAYAITLCGVLGDYEGGYRFGQLSLALVEKLGAESFRPGVLFIFNNFVRHWKEPLRASLDGLASATRAGLETGNLFEAVWACFYRTLWSFETGAELSAVERDLEDHAALFAQDKGAKNLSSLVRQVVHDLATPRTPLRFFAGPHYDESSAHERFATSSDATEVAAFHVLGLELALLFGDTKRAVESADHAARYAEAITGLPYVPLLLYLGALARLAHYRQTNDPALLQSARKSATKLRALASSSPGHHAHRALLVDAEIARALGRSDTHDRYDKAIRAARAAGVLRDEALACELASAHHAERGNEVLAQALFGHAVTAYRQWGARAKVQQMLGATAGARDHASAAEAQGGSAIDLESLMKASSAVTSELVLSRLLGRLIALAIENAGAETGALILAHDGQLTVEAMGTTSGEPQIARAALGAVHGVSEAIVRYVVRTGEHVVLEDASAEGPFRDHADITARKVRSVLCAPIKLQGALTGIVYLENNLTPRAFTRDRIELLGLLAAQAAIGLENARLFDNLERALAAQVELTDAHRRFVPDEFLQSLGRGRIVDVKLGDSVSKEMTVLFSDIRAFTSHVEGMKPEENIDFINEYLRHMEPAIVRQGGFVDSYIGDAIMALFDGETDRAVAASIDMLRALATLNAERTKRGKRSIAIGIGINAGPLTLGTIGGGNRIKCGVIGDTVNLAARVETLTKTYRVPLLASEHVLRRLRDPSAHDVRVVDRVRVVGKVEPVTLHEIYDADPLALRDAKRAIDARWNAALAQYYARDFEGATVALEACATAVPDDVVVRAFVERNRRHLAGGVPADWNGVEDTKK